MHQTDSFVLLALVLASALAIKLAPVMIGVLLMALVKYRRAIK